MGARQVVILGAGVGGLVAARRLRRTLPARDRIVVVDRAATSLFAPSLPWLVSGARRLEQIQANVAAQLGSGTQLVRGEVEAIDPVARRAHVGGAALEADALLVALGADLAPGVIPGLAAAGHDLYSAAGATAFRAELEGLGGGHVVLLTATPAYKCPAAPYEMAMLVEAWLRRRRRRGQFGLDLFAAEPAPLPVAGPAVGTAIREMLAGKGIGYHPAHQVERVDPEHRTLVFTGGREVPFDLLGFIPPHRAPAAVAAAGLTGPSGWGSVDRQTLATTHSAVYAVGDVTSIPLAVGKPLPKAGVFAHRQAEVVAANIVHEWTGKGKPAVFDGYGACFVEVGDGRAGYGGGDFYAEPAPRVTLRPPSRWAHWGKALYERLWLNGFLVGLPV